LDLTTARLVMFSSNDYEHQEVGETTPLFRQDSMDVTNLSVERFTISRSQIANLGKQVDLSEEIVKYSIFSQATRTQRPVDIIAE
jgi:hypothetical protein